MPSEPHGAEVRETGRGLRLEEATSATIDGLEQRMEDELPSAASVEDAAQRFASMLYDTFSESVVLARVFVTVRLGSLPPANQEFVRRLVGSRATAVGPDTPVLSLLGTRGARPEWNSRHLSKGHVGIPLASAEFIDAIPMIASLIKQLGVAIAHDPGVETAIVTHRLGSAAGLFYVEDASTATDSRGRRVIAAADFVAEHGVKTVFGFGGVYALSGTFVVAVVFARDALARRQAERFMRLANLFKAITMRMVARKQFFTT